MRFLSSLCRHARLCRWLMLGLLTMLAWPAQAEPVFSFSVAPQFERRILFGIWQPIVDELEKRTGQRFELVTSLSVGEYDADVRRGAYDFVYANPYLMESIDENPGYIALVRDSQPLHGILFVRQGSPVKRIEDLQGKSLAVPSMSALGASLLLRAELDRQYGVKMVPLIAKTHSSVFLHVLNGLADAGGSVQKAFAEQDPRAQGALRILHRTRNVPPHPIAAHRRVPEAIREKVRQAFIAMSASEEGRQLLARVPMQQAVAATSDEYHVIRGLKLENYLSQ